MPKTIEERVAAVEKWTELHPKVHDLEEKALKLAFKVYQISHKALEADVARLKELSNSNRGSTETEKTLLDRFLPWLLAAAVVVAGYILARLK